jgi:diaminopropionate ammonia-lyase
LGYLAGRYPQLPVTAIVEPLEVACIYASARTGDGLPHTIDGLQETMMAGLNCGRPCTITWPILRDYARFYCACPDFVSAQGMRLAARPEGSDPAVVSGESGAVSLGLLALLGEREELAPVKAAMGLNADATVLLFSTEGATDPAVYDAVVQGNAHPLPF